MVAAMAMANNGLPSPLPPPLSSQPRHVTSEITDPAKPKDYWENGRLYHGFHSGKYWWPIDEQEKDRMDIMHKFFLVARKNKLFSVKFASNYDEGPRVLDLGTGTGIWGIDMAEALFPHKPDILGYDLAIIQPQIIIEGVNFRQRDIDAPWWGVDKNAWDMIHIRMLAGSIESWPELHLKPSFGWLEHVEMDFYPRCDDGPLPSDSVLFFWIEKLYEASRVAQRPLAYNTETRRMLETFGFVDINEEVIKVPLNSWSDDEHDKDVGRWYNLAMLQGVEAMTLAPMTRVFKWPKSDVDRLIAEVKREMTARKHRIYNTIHIWTARRPGPQPPHPASANV